MTRTLEDIADTKAIELLDKLADRATGPSEYQRVMYELGKKLGDAILAQADVRAPRVTVVSTVEDADYLSRGIIESLTPKSAALSLICFWNSKVVPFGREDDEITPIVRKYEEETARHIDWLVVVKSVIAGGCVVKTNLTEVIEKTTPDRIFIAAPVMHSESEKRLRAEFARSITKKFKFCVFARDDVRAETGELLPGIGGDVYSRLGFGSMDDKNAHTPNLVKERRGQQSQLMAKREQRLRIEREVAAAR